MTEQLEAGVPGRETARVLADVADERMRQDDLYGPQSWPNGTDAHYRKLADSYRRGCDRAAEAGLVTWRHILLEEVYEAIAEEDPAKLRTELIQVAAVATNWVEDIDRKAAGA